MVALSLGSATLPPSLMRYGVTSHGADFLCPFGARLARAASAASVASVAG